MTLTVEPIVGSTRVVVLAPDARAVRDAAAEFRRFGISIVLRGDIVAALTEVVHDPTAMLIVSSDIPCDQLRNVLDLAVATCGASVILGLAETMDIEAVRTALRAGVRTTIDLPVSAERLSQTLRVLPAAVVETRPITIGDLTVDAARHRIEWAGTPIEASPREFAVVLELARNHPQMVGLDQLAADYQETSADPYATVRVVIHHLRTRISRATGAPGAAIIETVRGIGYRLAG